MTINGGNKVISVFQGCEAHVIIFNFNFVVHIHFCKHACQPRGVSAWEPRLGSQGRGCMYVRAVILMTHLGNIEFRHRFNA